MKQILFAVILLTAGLCVGGGIGYAIALMKAGSRTVLLTRPGSDKFAGVYSDMGKLYAAEVRASNCNATADIESVLSNEGDLIRNLRKIESSSVVDVAEARLATRIALSPAAGRNPTLQAEQQARIQKLLQTAGWNEPSAAHMRQIVLQLDKEQCQLLPSKGSRRP